MEPGSVATFANTEQERFLKKPSSRTKECMTLKWKLKQKIINEINQILSTKRKRETLSLIWQYKGKSGSALGLLLDFR